MKVSVIVPVYGVERFIGECAESLFSQTYDDLEYIFVDDCSPDNSIGVLQNVLARHPGRSHQVRIIRNTTNRGSGATRSIALAAATGDFVMYADSDDMVPTDGVEKLVRAQQASGADIVDGAYCRIHDSHITQPILPFHGCTADMLRLMLAQNTLTHQVWARLIRRTLHTENHVDFVDGINMAEDYCIMSRLLFCTAEGNCGLTHGQAATGAAPVRGGRAWTDEAVYLYREQTTGTFSSWLNDRHIGSYLSASRVVGEFLRVHDHDRKYTYAYELGMLNTIHSAMGVTDMETIRRLCPYHPTTTIFRLCRALLCYKATRPLLRATYLIIKRLYVTKITKNVAQFTDF